MEIPLLPAQRHRHACTIGTANLENKMSAEVIWKILTLLPKGRGAGGRAGVGNKCLLQKQQHAGKTICSRATDIVGARMVF